MQRGFTGVGYHYFIRKDGTIEIGRGLERIPAAQRGHNTGSIAICVSGKKDFQKIQFKNLRKLINDIEKSQGKKLRIRLHNEVNKEKTCPNFSLKKIKL